MSIPEEIHSEFERLLQAATDAGDPEPTAMTLATADSDGRISARTVLLKAFDQRGFVFYTNYQSNKGRQLLANPRAALLFLWKTLGQQTQVKVEGTVQPVSTEEADAYFAERHRGSQIGAWASLQSAELADRQELEQRIAKYEQEFANQVVPRPPHWSGFRVVPNLVEFWHGRTHRLHERVRYEEQSGQWRKRLLYP